MKPIQGIHHITAMASNPQRNVDFYSQLLGQRFVKKTVNFDDPGTYHLYYGDLVGSPGTIMTFFPWPQARRGRRGSGEIGASAYKILPTSLDYWKKRLSDMQIAWSEETRFGETVLLFPDPDDMMIQLVATEQVDTLPHWENGPIPAEHALRGFHSVTLWLRSAEETAALLTNVFHYAPVGREQDRLRFQGGSHIGEFIDILLRPEMPRGQMGAGSVHHVAFRTIDDSEQLEYQTAVTRHGLPVTDVKDRQYFHSIYFREPGGVLFEVATDAPGFDVDEPAASLGKTLKLPPWLEPSRPQIEQILPPLTIAEYA